MSYDSHAESLRLIAGGELTPVPRLSRRRRWAAMAVDVAPDVAVTLFARRSVGCIVAETHVLSRHRGQWVMLGGGGGPLEDDALADRPAELPAEFPGELPADMAESAGIVAIDGAGGVRDSTASPWSLPRSRWISYVRLQVSAAVSYVRVDDRRIDVPWHGHCVVGWRGSKPQPVSLHGPDDALLKHMELHPVR